MHRIGWARRSGTNLVCDADNRSAESRVRPLEAFSANLDSKQLFAPFGCLVWPDMLPPPPYPFDSSSHFFVTTAVTAVRHCVALQICARVRVPRVCTE